MTQIHTIYTKEQPTENSEIFSTLFQNDSIKIESIKSWLKTPGEFYNQDHDEWVLLLSGEARLEIENNSFNLKAGDYCFISRNTLHRVLSTSKGALWIGIFSS
ncbi:MAG: cupin domain-containing protein [Sulfuricurvum sp.]|uniref:cupin domain-containing protein n=1 Tax=Sulfuricurvum sp. TaxID=2025608 RepID=UPI002732EEC9|nr:cupin domain-containing protein [Sulfuricurvum sp.]MDP2849463.1 cupin domain-containing protein [Sulfuricurvum sp.]